MASCRFFASVAVKGDRIPIVSRGLPTTIGTNEYVAGEDNEFDRLEKGVAEDTNNESWEFCGVADVGDGDGKKEDRPVGVPVRVILSLEIVCAADVVAEPGNKGSSFALDDVIIPKEMISVLSATTDKIREEVGCELRLLNSDESY